MTDLQGAFDQQAHACYVEATSALSPAMQGRLRAARRAALAAPARHRVQVRWQGPSPLLPVGAAAAALLAVAVGLHWQPAGESSSPRLADASVVRQSGHSDPASQKHGRSSAPSDAAATPEPAAARASAASTAQDADAALAGVRSADDEPLLMLDEDPDFYLWLGSDDALPANAEPGHDPT